MIPVLRQGSVPPLRSAATVGKRLLATSTLCVLMAACGGSPTVSPREVSHRACTGLEIEPLTTSQIQQRTWTGGYVGCWPAQGAVRGAVILHQGHNSFRGEYDEHSNLVPVAEAFAAAGYTVYGMEMPIPPHDGRPLSDFLDPVQSLLEQIGRPAYMIGLSGGGWTTTYVTAQDPRIVKGYSVAGDAPPSVWIGPRDWEQQQVDYWQLYAQAGPRLLHLYNQHDSCCFWGITGDVGYFYLSDDNSYYHQISPWSQQQILADMDRENTDYE